MCSSDLARVGRRKTRSWASTTALWGNNPNNPNRLQVQNLCRQIIDRSDGNPANDSLSAFDTNSGSQYGPAGPNGFVRPGLPFFTAENEIPQGNKDLGVETAKTWTLGVVFRAPGKLEGLTASVDFYNIEITNAIATINSTFVYSKCFNASGSNPTYALHDAGGYCDLITRDPVSGERSTTAAPYKNSGILKSRGLDLAANWTKDFQRAGSFYINNQITFLDQFAIQDAASEPVLNVRDTLSTSYYGAQYKYKLNTTVGYNLPGGKTSLGLNMRYLPSIRAEAAARNPATTTTGAKAYSVFNLFARAAVNEKLEFRGGIDNLLDRKSTRLNSSH